MSLHSLETCDLLIPRQPHRLHQLVDPPRRHAADPGLLDHRDQRLLRDLPRLQERREVAPLPQLRDAQLQRAQPRVEHAVAVAVAPGRALAAALVPPGADQPLDVGFHQHLQHRLRHGSQKIAVAGLLQQLGQRQSLLGHRVLSRSWLKSRNSTLADWPDDHPRLHRNATSRVAPNLHHVRGRYLRAPRWTLRLMLAGDLPTKPQ